MNNNKNTTGDNTKHATNNQLRHIASTAMQSACKITPRPFQLDVITHTTSMWCKPNVPQVTLLVQQTGSGKSSVCQTIGMIDAGIVLFVETTISLRADQVKKIKQASLSYVGPANVFQLDVI